MNIPGMCVVQAQLPGRLWEGKASVAVALAAIMESCPAAVGRPGAAAAVAALVEAAGGLPVGFHAVCHRKSTKASLQPARVISGNFQHSALESTFPRKYLRNTTLRLEWSLSPSPFLGVIVSTKDS